MTMIVIIMKMTTTKTTTTMIVMINQDVSSTSARRHFAVCLTSSMGRSAAVQNREGNQDGDGNLRREPGKNCLRIFNVFATLSIC